MPLERVLELPQGGTAVGTGINTHAEFGARFAAEVARVTGLPFMESVDHFEAQATIDAPVELSGQLKTIAVSLMKIANDLRWMNSGPKSGISDVMLAPAPAWKFNHAREGQSRYRGINGDGVCPR